VRWRTKSEILFIGQEMTPLVEVSRQLDSSDFAISIARVPRPFDYLLRHRTVRAAGAVVRLSAHENVADYRAVCPAFPETAFVFLSDSFPPSPAVARVVEEYHGAVLKSVESPLAIVATLIALIFQRRGT
jgi:hypothetical protein